MFNFDNTLLCDFARCEAAGIARHGFKLTSKDGKLAADIGNVFHAGLELHFKGAGKREITAAFEAEYDKVVPPGEQPAEDRFGRKNCIVIMERYVDTRPVEKMPWTTTETEVVRGMELAPGYVFWVKRDLLGVDKSTGFYVPVDHKTTGKLTQWWARKWRLTSQFSGYCWFTGQEFGQGVYQAYVNAMEVGKLPDSAKRCKMHGVKFSECYAEHANFQIYKYTRSQEQIDTWKRDALTVAKQAELLMTAFCELNMLPYARRTGAFNDSCVFCEYKEWCANNFAPELAGTLTVYSAWEPWKEGQIVTSGWRQQQAG